MKNIHSHRKDEHISLAEKYYQEQNNEFDNIRLLPNSFSNLGINDIDLSTTLAGIKMDFPFYIQAMTGGSERTGKLNQRLAYIAKKANLAMAVGSQSVALKYPELADTFQVVRENNPNGFILGNLSADTSLDNFVKATQMIKADAMELHINIAQELVMPEGDRNFNYLSSIEKLISNTNTPIIIKSVGQGLSVIEAQQLQAIGVKNIDVGGRGGTNFIQIENERRKNKDFAFLENFGLTTIESIQAASTFDFSIGATGGIRNASDIIKCLCLGADNVGIAGMILHMLIHQSDDEIVEFIEELKYQLKSIMVLIGEPNIKGLSKNNLLKY